MDKDTKRKGLTLIEALVSTVIVGIGFIAVFQMVQYSVFSIDASGNRSKNSFLVNIIAEDVLANKNYKRNGKEFYQVIRDKMYMMNKCTSETDTKIKTNTPDNKIRKWDNLFNKNNVKCKKGDRKMIAVKDLCNSIISADKKESCRYTNDNTYSYLDNGVAKQKKIYDKRFFGIVAIEQNKKLRKKIYFQIK
jgi:Tfp pilus assembly protein PilV